MADKIFNTRIALKIDTLANWNNSTIGLKKGELALATVAASAGTGLEEPVIMAKIGEDGEKTFSQLDWNFYAKAADVLAACKDEQSLKAFINGVIADAGIASSDAMEDLAKRVTSAEGSLKTLGDDMDNAEGKIATLEGLHAIDDQGKAKTVVAEISAAIQALDLANTYVKQETGKGLSTNDYTTAEKDKLAGIAANANNYVHATHNAYASGLYKVTVDAEGHVSQATAVAKSDITGLGIPAQDTTYDEVSSVAAGLMSVADKAKLDAIAAGATNVTVDADLSTTSENAIQNKAVTAEINALKGLHATGTDGKAKTVVAEISDALTGLNLGGNYASKSEYDTYVKSNDAAIQGINDALDVLNGAADEEGSVDYKVAQEVAKIINDNDATAIDTLEEIAAWIVNDKTGAAEISNTAKANKTAIETMQKDATIKTFKGIEDKIGPITATTVAAEIEAAKTAAITAATYNDEPVKALEALHATNESGQKLTVAAEISGAIKDIADASHTHTNGTVLDGISEAKVNAWDAAAARIGTADDVLVFDCGTASTVI